MSLLNETNRRWWILAAMTCSLSLVFIDQTGVSVALPPIQRDLNTSSVMLQWVINAYLLALSAMIIFGGKLGDLFSHRKAYLCGVVTFILASLFCAMAPTVGWLIAFRVLQGIGGAFMIPCSGAIMINSFDEKERGKAVGLYVGIASLFLMLGAWIAGLLTEYFSWRWVFGMNFPLAIVSVTLTLFAVPEREKTAHTINSIDWIGFILQAVFMCAIVIATMEATNLGWTSPFILSLYVLGIVSLIAFLKWEVKQKNPLIELTIFKNLVFMRATIILVCMQVVFITFVFWTIYLQDVLGVTPSVSGLMTLPIPLMMTVMAPIAGRLRDRFGPRLPITVGTALSFAISLWVGFVAFKLSYAWLFPAFVLCGCTGSLVISNCMASAITSVEPRQRGVATGILSGGRQLGGTLGLAIFGSVIANINQGQLGKFLRASPAPLNQLHEKQIDGILAGAASAKQIVAKLPLEIAQQLHAAAINAYLIAFCAAMVLSALFGLIAFVFARKMPTKVRHNSA